MQKCGLGGGVAHLYLLQMLLWSKAWMLSWSIARGSAGESGRRRPGQAGLGESARRGRVGGGARVAARRWAVAGDVGH